MATAKEHMAADMTYVLADTDVDADDFTFDGIDSTGTVVYDGQDGLGGYDSFVAQRVNIVVGSEGFPDVFPGSSHDFNGEPWTVDSVVSAPGSLVLQLSRNVA